MHTAPPMIRPTIEALADSPIVEVWRMGYGRQDVIGMFAGEPDLPTPAFICEAASQAMAAGKTFYTPNRGIPAVLDALVDYLRDLYGVTLPTSRIALTQSGMQAVMLLAQATISPGDNVVVITPSWPNIARAMQICGAEIREVPMTPGDDGWTLDLDRVAAACDERSRLLYLASPGNPTGWMIERPQAEALLAMARERNLAILADEVYHRTVYDRRAAFSFLEIAQPADRVFIVNSFSKAWAMTGWRLGWVVYPEGVTETFEKLIQFNTAGAPEFLQHGAIAALRQGEDFVAEFAARCGRGRAIVNERLAAMPRVTNTPSAGAFYAMFTVDGVRDTLRFCTHAVTEGGIGMAPGIAFASGAERHIRLCYAKSPALLHEAMDRLARFTATYREA